MSVREILDRDIKSVETVRLAVRVGFMEAYGIELGDVLMYDGRLFTIADAQPLKGCTALTLERAL